MKKQVRKTAADWRAELTPEQYWVCRQQGTEPPFSGRYHAIKAPGRYRCVCCGTDLFDAAAKFDSGTGWPSFWQPSTADAVATVEDHSHGMQRIEVRCSVCEAHLGHVFPDGPKPTGQRYCINSIALEFVPADAEGSSPSAATGDS